MYTIVYGEKFKCLRKIILGWDSQSSTLSLLAPVKDWATAYFDNGEPHPCYFIYLLLKIFSLMKHFGTGVNGLAELVLRSFNLSASAWFLP